MFGLLVVVVLSSIVISTRKARAGAIAAAPETEKVAEATEKADARFLRGRLPLRHGYLTPTR